ncbi:protein kinase [Kitasatospora sp. NBC_00240]|uniref:protein kinase domain-containing protein n=1 Tax=Kitasatospora sp. NBC_00240 TaxID=2903567 RepID=UPI00224D0D80|nr:serine/threonine-protein kinase [Kitasatospora sp. NBC_00240]MCX5211084.1 protein kinase [Kitasatospora sp. NBC_00240]
MTAPRVIGGRYRLAEKIGHGGMGQVWAAYDERLDRRVAVKLLHTDHLLPAGTTEPHRRSRGEELRRRFLRECRITAALDHPGLVTVFDAGEDDGELHLVMQRVPGLSLADLIAEEAPFPIGHATAVAAQLCAALAVVHAVPVVHRDIKPSNVMVREDGRVVLLDLGIATAVEADATRLTLTGVPIGSPAYMAPEQALAATADARSDLYALGCLLHEMLCGEEPFRAPTALGVLRRHVDEPPVPLRELRPEVPAPLEALVLDLLAKQPADRPADAQQVYARLLPMLPPAAGPQPQPPYGPVPDPTRPFRYPGHPRPAPVPVGPPVAVLPPATARPAAAGAVPGQSVPARQPDPPGRPGAASPGRTEPRPLMMTALPGAPARDQYPSPAGPQPWPPAAQGPSVPGPPAQGPVAQPPAVGDLAEACADLSDLVAAKRHAEVIDLAARLLPRARAEQGDGAPLVHTIRTIYARTLLHERRFRDALPEYLLLAATAEGGPHGAQGLDHRHRAADCLEQLGEPAQALAEYQALLAARSARLDAGLDPGPERVHDLRERIGLLLAAAGDPDNAWQWLLQLLLDRERLLGPHHPDVRRLRQSLDQLQQHRRTGNPPAAPAPGPVPAPATPPATDPRSAGWPTPAPGNPYATGR